jgi:hypothetical protein
MAPVIVLTFSFSLASEEDVQSVPLIDTYGPAVKDAPLATGVVEERLKTCRRLFSPISSRQEVSVTKVP